MHGSTDGCLNKKGILMKGCWKERGQSEMSHISIFLSTMAKPHEFPDSKPHSLTLAFTWLPHVLCLSFQEHRSLPQPSSFGIRSELGNTSKKETIWYHHCWPCPCPDTLHMGNMRRVLMGLFLYYINSGIVGLSLRIVISRGFQKFNGTPGVEFFILLGFTEPATHVIQACFYIR